MVDPCREKRQRCGHPNSVISEISLPAERSGLNNTLDRSICDCCIFRETPAAPTSQSTADPYRLSFYELYAPEAVVFALGMSKECIGGRP
jgi:hypothetical protein